MNQPSRQTAPRIATLEPNELERVGALVKLTERVRAEGMWRDANQHGRTALPADHGFCKVSDPASPRELALDADELVGKSHITGTGSRQIDPFNVTDATGSSRHDDGLVCEKNRFFQIVRHKNNGLRRLDPGLQ